MSSVAEAEKKNDLSGLGFDPTDKELEIFHKEKMDMYKGTFIVCLVYAISAMTLLGIIFWTDWGREYIYHKMLPASVTFIIGALFIIIFLVITIYNLKPRRVRNNIEKDEEIVCPDFWVLKKVEDNVKKDIVDNNTKSGKLIIEDIKSKNDDALKYKCELDPKVYGDLTSYATMKKNLYEGKSTLYNTGRKYKNIDDRTKQDYLYIHKKSSSSPSTEIPYTNEKLSKYAQFSGMYQSEETDSAKASKHDDNKMKNNSIILDGAKTVSTQANYNSKVPLICNVVYPQVLAKWDKDTLEQNKYRCEYAKACDIAWSDIGCEYKPPV